MWQTFRTLKVPCPGYRWCRGETIMFLESPVNEMADRLILFARCCAQVDESAGLRLQNNQALL